MATTAEETVNAPKGNAAFDAARASVRASEEVPAETPADDTPPATPPAQEPETPADEPKETGPEPDTVLTPEELAALPPKERANAEKWQAKLTQKSQALAARTKELEDWLPLIETLKTNPDAAIEALAQRQGFTVTKAQQDAIQKKTAELTAELPEELKFMQPIFEQFGSKLLDSVRGEIVPLKQATDQIMTQALAAETEATIKQFGAKHPGWEKHEGRMIELGHKILPAKGTTDADYMETLYTLAIAGISEAEKAKKIVDQINKSADNSEQKKSGVSESRVAQTIPAEFAKLDNKEQMRRAYEAAKSGISWEK